MKYSNLRGAAKEVPDMVSVAELLVIPAERMLEPGAKMSTQVPLLLNEERASVLVVEPTVMAVWITRITCTLWPWV